MLCRTYKLLTFIRRNVICTDQLCELKIGLAKRQASIYIKPKFGARFKLVAPKDFQWVHNEKSINNIDNLQCISLATLRAASSDTKAPGDTGLAAETKVETKSVEAKKGKNLFFYTKVKFHKFRAKLYLWRLNSDMNLCSMGENKSYCKREKSKFARFYLFFNNFVWKSAHFCIH